MIYPRHFEQKVDFTTVREMIRGYCISPMGKDYVDKIRFSSNKELIVRLLEQISEFKNILLSGEPFPAQDYFDLRQELARLKTPGTYIEPGALFDLKTSLNVVSRILDFIRKKEDDAFPRLKALAAEVDWPEEVPEYAERIIDDKGEIRSSASEKLAKIRKQLEAKERQVVRETRRVFALAKKSGWIPEDAGITIRSGRAVIPVKAADKRAFEGFVHDVSASGQTVFIEPAGSFEINNEIRELENEEKREIIRILTVFTDKIRTYLPSLFGAYRFLGLIDFIRAKALFAQKITAGKPEISNEKILILKKARHPLLYLSHREAGKEVVPLDLELNKENRILVISGPNAGGKSVCLKTVGLLQYMVQCGLHVSCSPDSVFPVFENLFIDIGDEQSLENDLSTYSSHLLNMKFFLRHANENTLFLIDEFGTGTEPQLGGAIAEATLEQLNKKGAFGVVTTHYTNLKLAAQRMEGLINGAMLFDSKAMQPLYQLQIGNPGSSFAFEIARKTGFPKYVLNRAKKKSGGKHVSFDKQLQQLEVDKLTLEKKQQEVHATDEQLSEMIEKYTNLLEEIKKTKKQIIREAEEEALRIIAGSNKVIEKTIKEIRETGADKEKTKEIRKKLRDKKQKLENIVLKEDVKKTGSRKKEKQESPEPVTGDEPLKAGDYVRIKNTDIIGELLSVEGEDAIVDVNEIKLKTSLRKLVKTERAPFKKISFRSKQAHRNILSEINEKAAHFNLTIDLRGKRADEALAILKKYIDDAILLNIGEVNILHGKGDGILRPLIREYLHTIEEIKSFGDAPLETGGAGITRVFFR
ncbi:MAG: endonuclease MutS2 [Chlorobi bacterium]|nr:endonuclease MutS2 [Chlorobiota bacterium]